MVKPHAVLFLAGCAAAAAISARRAGRSGLGAAGTMLGAGLVAPGLIFGWLAAVGGLAPFFEILTEWTVPFYSRLGGAGPLWHLVTLRWGFLGAAALLGAVRRAPEPHDVRRWLAVGGVVYGFLHSALQAKGYNYHLYPFACFLCLLAGLAMTPDPPGARSWPARVRGYAGGLPAALALALTLIVMGERGLVWMNEPWDANRAERVDAVVADLRKVLPPGGTVQVLGLTGGHVLLRLGLRQPTRFFTDFQFYVATADPRIQALRAELSPGSRRILRRPSWRFPGVASQTLMAGSRTSPLWLRSSTGTTPSLSTATAIGSTSDERPPDPGPVECVRRLICLRPSEASLEAALLESAPRALSKRKKGVDIRARRA